MYELPAPILFLDDIFFVIQVIKCSLLQYTRTIHLSNLDALYSTPGNCNIFYHSDNHSEYSTTNMESIFTARFSLNRLHLSTENVQTFATLSPIHAQGPENEIRHSHTLLCVPSVMTQPCIWFGRKMLFSPFSLWQLCPCLLWHHACSVKLHLSRWVKTSVVLVN